MTIATKEARLKLRILFPQGIRNVKFTAKRKDGTRGASWEAKTSNGEWIKMSVSYLTDIPALHKFTG